MNEILWLFAVSVLFGILKTADHFAAKLGFCLSPTGAAIRDGLFHVFSWSIVAGVGVYVASQNLRLGGWAYFVTPVCVLLYQAAWHWKANRANGGANSTHQASAQT